MSLIDDIRKALQGEKKSEFVDQILKEQAFYEALHKAGLTVTAADPSERGRLQPFGVLSKVMKIDLVDLITTISLIDLITRIALIDNITNVGTLNLLNTVNLIKSISSIDSITNIANVQNVDLIDAITNVGTLNLVNTINLIKSISSIDSITNIAKISDIPALVFMPFQNYIVNPDFEVADFRGWQRTTDTIILIDPASVGQTNAALGKYIVKIPFVSPAPRLRQFINKPMSVNNIVLFGSILWTMDATYQGVRIEFFYSDLSMDWQIINPTATPTYYAFTPTANKYLVGFAVSSNGSDFVYGDNFVLLVNETANVCLYAWDGSAWKKVRCDANGYLITTTPP